MKKVCFTLFFILSSASFYAQSPGIIEAILKFDSSLKNKTRNLKTNSFKKIVDYKDHYYTSKTKYGYADSTGKTVVPCLYYYLGDLCEGIAVASKTKSSYNGIEWRNNKAKYGYVNCKGEEITEFKYDEAYDFRDGFALVKWKDKGKSLSRRVGFIDKQGYVVYSESFWTDANDFENGFARVDSADNNYGYIDKSGKLAVPYIYSKAMPFDKNGLATVQNKKGRWGVINTKNKIVYPFISVYPVSTQGISYHIEPVIKYDYSEYYHTTSYLLEDIICTINNLKVDSTIVLPKVQLLQENGENFLEKKIWSMGVWESYNKSYPNWAAFNGGRSWFVEKITGQSFMDAPNNLNDESIFNLERVAYGGYMSIIRYVTCDFNFVLINEKGEKISNDLFHGHISHNPYFPSLPTKPDRYGSTEALLDTPQGRKHVYINRNGEWFFNDWERDRGLLPISLQIAEEGDTLMQLEVAAKYYAGYNEKYEVTQNYGEAFNWFLTAAKQGNSRAQYMVGWMYQHGQGTKINLNQAMVWYAKSKEPDAANQIAEIKKGNINPEPTPVRKNLAIIELAGLAEETTEREVTLRAGIKSDSYISDVRVMLNGNVVEPADRGANVVRNDGNDRTITKKLTLREGSNIIKVIAKNDGGEATAERTIVYRVKNLPILEWRNDIVSVGSNSYHLQLGVRTKSGIVSRMVMLNGKRIDEADRGANSVRNDGYDMVIDRYLMLSEGNNVIKVSVTNAEGTATAERLVTYTKPTPTERRIALVIGNATYNNPCFPNLRNPLNDAKAMYNKFKTLGFDLMPILLNAGRTKMWNAIEEFVDSIEKGNYEVALIYYSGHGLSPDGGANYLIPTDASIKYVDEIKRDGLNSQTDLIAKLEKKKCRVKIALLDCCNNCNVPERGVKNAANLGGMAMMRPPHGISILHAAQPRRTAFDGNSSNSPFVEAFLECADKYADEPWQTFITQVTNLVDTKTKGEQIPYPEGQIRGKFFYLNPNHK